MRNYLSEKVKLNDGYSIPLIGAGLWQVKKEVASEVACNAISCGYIHLDDAVAYANEKETGEGIIKSGAKREDLFITSKVPAEVKKYDDAKRVIKESIERLNCNYLDLMLIHAPRPWAEMFLPIHKNYFKENVEVYRALEEAKNEGLIRSIGVSNFNVKDLQNIMNNCSVPIAVNQIRIHIGHVPEKVINFCKENNIVVEAYSPLGTGRLLKNKKVIYIAKKYNVSASQLCIKFILQLDLVVLPKTTHLEYMKSNSQLDFEISESDMEILKNLPFVL